MDTENINTSTTRLTQSEVRDLFRYNRKTGGMYWKKTTTPYMKSYLIGERYGCKNDKAGAPCREFRQGKVYGITYLEHQLVYLYHHGHIPNHIRHRNGDLLDNRIGNLEQVDEDVRR